jgi:signal transduction histidine kinase
MTSESLPELGQAPFFSRLVQSDLETLASSVRFVRLEPGQYLFHEADEANSAYLIKQGQIEILKTSYGRQVLLALRGPGDVIGEIALLDGGARSASARARSDSLLFEIPKEEFDRMVSSSPTAARSLLQAVTARLAETEGIIRQKEKMAQLGTMTAGVAHELNNPSAAAQQSALDLKAALEESRQAELTLHQLGLSGTELEQIEALAGQVDRPTAANGGSLARHDRRQRIEAWLESHDDEPWKLAADLSDAGLDEAKLEALRLAVDEAHLLPILTWWAARSRIAQLIEQIAQATGRISAIVSALRGYSYLDQAPIQQVDLHEGLENTLTLLGHRIPPGVQIDRAYAAGLPTIEAFGSELNQVWTNLISNAIDGVGEEGLITLRTASEGAWVIVEVEDNGPGIAPEDQGRVFDPFFTTKPPGAGTGLGLNVTYNIVSLQHSGEISLRSEPGATVFRVRLPVQMESRGV